MTFVDSSRFSELPRPQRFYELAIAYLQSAKCLSADMIATTSSLTWPRASVALYCVTQAIELFLKAAILAKSPRGEKLHHNISELMKRYMKLYPNPAFYFHTPWNVDIQDLARAFGGEVVVSDTDRKPDQLYRYYSDKSDELPKAIHSFGPGIWLEAISQMEDNWSYIWARILEELDSSETQDE